MAVAVRCLAILCSLAVCPVPIQAMAGAEGMVGGPCRYASFPGKGTIVSVGPVPPGDSGNFPPTPYPPLAVTFTFTPNAPVAGEPDAPHAFTLANGMPPGPRYVERYGLAPGSVLPCELRRIRHGTCTPVLYVFPGIDAADYFELERP
ncbi:hypothetical protein DFW101_0787 [Solidesulfovibrio carbinoliphilus subsp. oakridgensis]|uniref:Lipoprotein n=1 Tax=Solidesulfovibrio carbinoliphilus subsp. oakridgensis TaxID=694327 RepID=G7Q414_9BACT|nr:hypothetical protein [Solidesulfovibrio carbinoliphilus]EHJ46804.1 hypothetical protein DFW101_0787 [Solidesulfovibrio carbinoliphilus subsp. oakridgensis]